eukprot:TRINITY_DN23971_c0_g2_i1.p1 TRINITY_DN23971_c0_g2~~TRINITY_DN23971_c0_g2_i1.p1  ORF type:complete len:1300 (-),score=196.30 TRINITY_DN23971_c0_g2_i1:318-3728(-)
MRAKARARWSMGEVATFAAEQESALARAEVKKAYLPYGVGLTAIFAAACTSLRLFNESTGDFIPEDNMNPPLIAADNALLVLLAGGATVAATLTSLSYLDVRAALTLGPEEQAEDAADREGNEWEQLRLPGKEREAGFNERLAAIVSTVALSFLPVYVIFKGSDLSTLISESGQFNHVFQELLDESAVGISTLAAAQAALLYLIAEVGFTDAEQRVAIKCKQAALAELFFAQAQGEAAMLPVRTSAISSLSVASGLAAGLLRQFTLLAPWASTLGTIQSVFKSKLVSVESRAAELESRIARRGPRNWSSSLNAVSSSLSELQRLTRESSSMSNKVRETLEKLPAGETYTFAAAAKEDRREIHLLAAELLMFSQSQTIDGERVVKVRNAGLTVAQSSRDDISLDNIKKGIMLELQEAGSQGLPDEWKPIIIPTGLVVLSVQCAPFVLFSSVIKLLIPLVTGGLTLITVFQEKSGKEIVADSKNEAATLQRRQAEAETLLGLALLAGAALPLLLAVSSVSTGCAYLGLSGYLWTWIQFPMTLLSAFTVVLSRQRQKQIRAYLEEAARAVNGEPPEEESRSSRIYFALSLLVAMVVPVTLIGRLTAACAICSVKVGFIQADCSKQLALSEQYVALADRAFARTDAWAQEASTSSRALPLGSAYALVNTLVATSLAASNIPFGTVFPILGFGIVVRAIQKESQARKAAAFVTEELRSLGSALVKAPPYTAGSSFEPPKSSGSRRRREEPLTLLKAARTFLNWQALRRFWSSFLNYWAEKHPTERKVDLAEQTVKSVQADLDELRVTVKSTDNNLFTVGLAVALLTSSAVVAPLLLPTAVTQVVLPVAGTGLTIFVVQSEADARRRVAQSKVYAAGINEKSAAMEELQSLSQSYKARILSLVVISEANVIFLKVLTKASSLCMLKSVAPVILIVAQFIFAAQGLDRLSRVRQCTEQVQKLSLLPTSVVPPEVSEPARTTQTLWALVALLPTLVVTFLSLGITWQKQIFIAAELSALMNGFVLLAAERLSAQGEQTQSGWQRAFALADAFANRAEEQGALLPLASAATIAVAGVGTFFVELNPYSAAALTILQALTWVVASRKSVATKFESQAGLQVKPMLAPRKVDTGASPGQQLKMRLLN